MCSVSNFSKDAAVLRLFRAKTANQMKEIVDGYVENVSELEIKLQRLNLTEANPVRGPTESLDADFQFRLPIQLPIQLDFPCIEVYAVNDLEYTLYKSASVLLQGSESLENDLIFAHANHLLQNRALLKRNLIDVESLLDDFRKSKYTNQLISTFSDMLARNVCIISKGSLRKFIAHEGQPRRTLHFCMTEHICHPIDLMTLITPRDLSVDIIRGLWEQNKLTIRETG